MNEEHMASIPFAAHELEMARMERSGKRLWLVLILCLLMLFASNALWLYAWCQYDYLSEEVTVEQDTKDGGNANYIGNDGKIVNGVSESDCTPPQTD